MSGAQGFVIYLFWIVAIILFVADVYALVDALRTPSQAFPAAGKMTKQIWLLILAFSVLFGLASAVNILPLYTLLPLIAFIAAAIYLADVRPAVREFRGGKGGQNQGPYGPW